MANTNTITDEQILNAPNVIVVTDMTDAEFDALFAIDPRETDDGYYDDPAAWYEDDHITMANAAENGIPLY